MGYRTKKETLATIVQRMRGGTVFYDAYAGYDPITKKQKRFQGRDLKKIKADIEEFYAAVKCCGALGVVLKPAEIVDARNAYDILYRNGVRVRLEDLARDYVGVREATDGDRPLGDAYDEYYTSFPLEQTAHRSAIHYRVGRWVEHYGREKLLRDITARDVVNWITEHYGSSNKTYNNYLTYIKAFLNWCTKSERGYLLKNPIADVNQRNIAYKEPEYMSAEDTERLFRAVEAERLTHPEYIAYAALSFLCGIRREEIMRMALLTDAATVNLEDETIRISKPKGWTRGISPRAFRIMPNALLWLKSIDFAAAIKKVEKHTPERVFDLASKNGVTVPRNAGRHTFITMHVAAYGDPSKTEAMVGTSKKMRVSNYCGLASHKEGEAYFAITPESAGASPSS